MNAKTKKTIVVPASKKKCFVTIGDPKRQKAYYEKVLVVVAKDETMEEAAEKFRVRVANEKNKVGSDTSFYLASDLYYMVFTNYGDKLPTLASPNAKGKVLRLRVKNEYA